MYFGDAVEKTLLDYIEGPRVVAATHAVSGEENALSFSLQKKRISVHAVENLVEKYAKEFVPQKKITPHKLRSTFGANLYQETGDIYLVADVLGHSDVGTTKTLCGDKRLEPKEGGFRHKIARKIVIVLYTLNSCISKLLKLPTPFGVLNLEKSIL